MGCIYLAGEADNLLRASGVSFSGDTEDSSFPHTNIANGRPWEMMRFNAAGTDDYIQADLGSSKAADFCSLHFHNLDDGIVVKLARGITGGTAVATLTKESPAFYKEFNSASDRYWRLTFEGTNSSAIYIGEWFLGAKISLTRPPDWRWAIGYRMPQRRVEGPSGLVLSHNLSEQHLRSLQLNFASLTDAHLAEYITMLNDCKWGEEPLVFVPDTNRNWVLHGRPVMEMAATLHPHVNQSLWRHGIEIAEDPGPIIVK